MKTRSSTRITALQLSLRASVAAALAIGIAQALKLPYPFYALIAAVLVMDLSPSKTRQSAWQRLVGTVIGTTVGAVLGYVLPAGPVAVGVSILLGMLLSFVACGPSGAKVGGYASGLSVMSYGAAPWSYALYRGIETLLGIGMAVLVSFVPKLMNVEISDETDA